MTLPTAPGLKTIVGLLAVTGVQVSVSPYPMPSTHPSWGEEEEEAEKEGREAFELMHVNNFHNSCMQN